MAQGSEIIVVIPPDDWRAPEGATEICAALGDIVARAIVLFDGDIGGGYGLVLSEVINRLTDRIGVPGIQRVLRTMADDMPMVAALNAKAKRNREEKGNAV